MPSCRTKTIPVVASANADAVEITIIAIIMNIVIPISCFCSFSNGFFNSIRAAYVRSEIKEMLTGFRPECYEIRHEFPFMQSVIIRKS